MPKRKNQHTKAGQPRLNGCGGPWQTEVDKGESMQTQLYQGGQESDMKYIGGHYGKITI